MLEKISAKLWLFAVLSLGIAGAQSWEYGLYQIVGQGNDVTHQWLAAEETTEPQPDPDALLATLAGEEDSSDLVPPLSILNFLGKKGWELVGLEISGSQITYFFKRPLPEG